MEEDEFLFLKELRDKILAKKIKDSAGRYLGENLAFNPHRQRYQAIRTYIRQIEKGKEKQQTRYQLALNLLNLYELEFNTDPLILSRLNDIISHYRQLLD